MGRKWIKKRIRIPAGPTVVWKKGRSGKKKPVMVRRKSYIKTIWVKDC